MALNSCAPVPVASNFHSCTPPAPGMLPPLIYVLFRTVIPGVVVAFHEYPVVGFSSILIVKTVPLSRLNVVALPDMPMMRLPLEVLLLL